MNKCIKNPVDAGKCFSLKNTYSDKITEDLNLFVTHLIPPINHTWDLNDEYRHQELKAESETGIKRQFDNLKVIKDLIVD